mmetsp:Transcript_1434/g.1888  ORF Transcript_1434/g.1888 Transcript_1434/m.1888 type:complete len:452 (+) Transcript_1434:47-1402(+)
MMDGGQRLVWLHERLETAVVSLSEVASRGEMPNELRSIAWRMFLGVLESSPNTWVVTIQKQREEYEQMRDRGFDRFSKKSQNPNEEENDDFIERGTSFAEEEDDLAAFEDAADQIKGDLERCYPEGADAYFLAKARQKLMFNVLLIWTIENPNLGYRQGMHELLAPLLYTMEQGLEIDKDLLPNESPLKALITDQHYLEHDTYWLFAMMIQQFIPLYDTTRLQDSLAVSTCRKIQTALLAGVDQELARHLASFGIGKDAVIPQVYMLSWLRVAFGRQLSIQDTISLWDFFFATQQNKGPLLLEWLEACAVLLIVLERDALLRAQSGVTCLQILLRTVAPEPNFFANTAKLIIDDPASMVPLINALQHRANLSHLLPHFFVSILSNLGFVATQPQTSLSKPIPSSSMATTEASFLSAIHPSNLCGRSVTSVSLFFYSYFCNCLRRPKVEDLQ